MALLEPVPDLVIGRTMKDVEGAEFYAIDVIGLGEMMGYKVEQHNITTTDGYLLKLFRIPDSPKLLNQTKKKPVVFLGNGMAATSDVWLIRGKNRSLAIQLADEGYDVWMANYRGTTYGRAHVKLSPDDRKFWDFSQHESGIYDFPNSIDYVLNVTNESSLTFIGHSLGTTTIFITLSELPQYNDKINLLIMLAPVSVWTHQSPLRKLGPVFSNILQNLLEPNGTIELIPQSSALPALFKRICFPNNIFDLCFLPFDLLLGKDHYQLDKKNFVAYNCHYPAGVSAKMMYHYFQSMESGKFRQWNFNNDFDNIKHYGQSEPPEYNLKNIKSPMIIYFNHIDFVTAIDVKKLVNDRIISRLNQFKNLIIIEFSLTV
ncbi:lipase 3-like [Aphidius gifuensis]|uniref:lipase 3-like n=1 Tax=Aphidius gifuensis TaxID=684658 RepID=UPI001CDD2047|nr:lipase 3-like [Aphidius gifuensis]